MDTIFLICAAAGGTVMVLQFVMLLIGIGGDHPDAGFDVDADADFDAGGHFEGDVHDGTADMGSSHLFEVLSLRTLIAAIAFFGLGGLLALRTGSHPIIALVVAMAAGSGALFAVYYLMKGLYGLRHDGTVRIQRTLGLEGTVYVPIPAKDSGTGKVQLHVQNRIMEFAAVTSADAKLTTGQKVVVTDVVDSQTVRVELLQDAVA